MAREELHSLICSGFERIQYRQLLGDGEVHEYCESFVGLSLVLHAEVPALRDAQAKVTDTKVRGRLAALIRSIRLTWPKNEKPPEWWQGSKN